MSKTHICLLSFIMGAGLLLNSVSVSAQLKAELDSPAVIKTPLITDIPARKSFSLNGKWQYIVDPYELVFTTIVGRSEGKTIVKPTGTVTFLRMRPGFCILFHPSR